MKLIARYDFTQTAQPPDWNIVDGRRTDNPNVVCEDGATSLWTRPYTGTKAGDPWRGGNLTLTKPLLYGKVAVDVRIDPAKNTKSLLLLWPEDWPPEIDFLEQGGNLNWDRQWIKVTAHFGVVDPVTKKHPMVHRSFAADMTQWSTVVCTWTPDTISVSHRPLGAPMQPPQVVIPNPGIDVPMKPKLTYWPHYSKTGGPWPEVESRMQVKEVRVWQ